MERYTIEQLIYDHCYSDDDAGRVALAAIIKKEYHSLKITPDKSYDFLDGCLWALRLTGAITESEHDQAWNDIASRAYGIAEEPA